MNRMLLTVAGVFSASSLLLVDSAIKGIALLIAAAVASLILKRDSAATRHFVWLLAIVALLTVPVMSALLPQWRVLPEWASIPSASPEAPTIPPLPAGPSMHAVEVVQNAPPDAVEAPSSISHQPAMSLPDSPPVLVPPANTSPAISSVGWLNTLTLVWSMGCCVLVLRLVAARWLLWNTERQGTVIWSTARGIGVQPVGINQENAHRLEACATGCDPLVAALEAACSQLGMRRPVSLLIHPDKAIPVVWGIFRCRLLLPAAAREWSSEQLQSVLLHELAHIKRRDTLTQLLTQIACALYWFNPLVWFAAWRLGVERERACDDLVLASGVRPSAYAGHLLDVVTKLSTTRWTQVCGLAMARKSSLEGRLVAVLSENRNRRAVSLALAALALVLALTIAVPLAMLRAADEKWNPPQAAHIGGNKLSTYCVHDGKTAAFVIVYRGDLDSSTSSSSNAKDRSWTDSGTLTAKKPGIALSFHRLHTTPDKLTITTAPADARDLSKPAPAPREFGQKEYDLTRGRVFLLGDDGAVRQLAIEAPAIRDQAAAARLEEQIAALPPQVREQATPKPKHEYAQSLFKKWQANARTDGKIPGALIGHVARKIDDFLKQYPKDDNAPKLAAIRPRLDASHDWTQADVVALLDEITAISAAPVSWADFPFEIGDMRSLKPGRPLPAELKNAAWGTPAANGLRAAWLLEPSAEQYPLGSVLKSRVLFHNTGKEPVLFTTETWHQDDPHTARDANGAEIKVSGTWYTGITSMVTYRLAPNEYCEVQGHGVAIGAGKYEEEFSVGSVGAIIEAKVGDEVRLTHSVDATYGRWTRPGDPEDPEELRKMLIAERVEREAPLPQSAADREQLIRRVTLDLFGVPPSAEEVAAFIADKAPDALAKLTARLQVKPHIQPYSGNLPTGETKFRVTAADPDAAKKPRTANRPGRYVLDDRIHLLVSQTTTGEQRTNVARIAFFSSDPDVAAHNPYEITLPDGLLTWAAVWERGTGELWIIQKGLARKVDFKNPAKVEETRFEDGGIANAPQQFHEVLKAVFNEPGAPVQQQESQKPKPGAKLKSATEQKLKWGEPVNGLRMALAWPPTFGEPGIGEEERFYLVVQNVSQAAIRFTANDAAPNPRRAVMWNIDVPMAATADPTTMPGDWLLQPREVAFFHLFDAAEKQPDGRTLSSYEEATIRKYPQYSLTAEMTIEKAPAGAWTGKLTTDHTRGSMDVITPKHKDAQALYKTWTMASREVDGKIPGGVIALLAESVRTFIKNNPTWETTPKLEKMLPRFDASHDWPAQEAATLLDELAELESTPVSMTLENEGELTVRTGTPLPPQLATAPWGAPQPNGLRLAWLLEPRTAEHRLGTPLKARVLIHNAGKQTVVFRTRTWHQVGHKAVDAKSMEIKVESTDWLTRGQLIAFRLAPGEFVEVVGPGIGVGPVGNHEDWQNTRVGSWVEAKAGDDVTVISGPVPLSDWNEKPDLVDGQPRWWLDYIKARLARHLPFPADREARLVVLHRVMIELFGTSASREMNDAFANDTTATALDSLAKRLFDLPLQRAWTGELTSGSTKFRVLPADPDAAKKPWTASNPGRYTLAKNAVLVVSRRPVDERLVNEATLQFFSPDPKADAPGKPIPLNLPDGYNTWAAAWVRGGTVLWVQQKDSYRSFDFTNPAEVKETTLQGPADIAKVPKPILDALRAELEVPDAPKPAAKKPDPPAATPK